MNNMNNKNMAKRMGHPHLLYVALHKNVFQTRSSLSHFIPDFEEISWHVSYSNREIISAKNLGELGRRSFPSQASDESPIWETPCLKAGETLSRDPI